ncbi:hypothetical protein LHP98_16135 [Rhodobacter sp. Har01]|uniref:hypothetical protein n=1 Tax=Rhodobacter sp. Har01 TaxID=2883999 RepID=UPI001D0916E6|nr:hypothetical protein [Rhodobacter sp. Har01]MCB6179652.1 hypothetical protein [Rhodobacter sp. Har01]
MRALALLAAAAMVVSLFLPWMNLGQAGSGFVPWDLIKSLDLSTDALQSFASESSPALLVFLATFVLAALFLILAILGVVSRGLALVTGGAAVGVVGYTFFQARQGALDLGVPVPGTNDLSEIANQATGLMGLGAWAWGAGAVILLLAGLVGTGQRA